MFFLDLETVTGIYLWSYRISLLILMCLSIVRLRRNKGMASVVISAGLILILMGTAIDYFSTFFLVDLKLSQFYPNNLHILSLVSSSVGYLTATFGCYKATFSNK